MIARLHPWDHVRPGRLLRAISVPVLAAIVVALGTSVASAQSDAPATTTPVTLAPENPGSGAASALFFAITGVIIVGALVLYVRHRGSGNV